MFKFFRKYTKQLLAISSVFLMISWMAGNIGNPSGNNNSGGAVVGTIDGDKITQEQLKDCKFEWDSLQRGVFNTEGFMIAGNTEELGLAKDLSDIITTRMRQNRPDFYLALQHDAARMAVTATPDQVTKFITAVGADSSDPAITQGLTHFIAVENAVRRMLDTVKISAPEAEQRAAHDGQRISVNVVELPYSSYLATVLPPTTQQVNDLYERGKNLLPSQDPMGFGYLDPNRVQLEWIEVPRDAVKKAISIPKKEQYVYYIRHGEKFQTTQPSTQSARSISLTAPLPVSTTRPFDEVQDEIVRTLTDQAADVLSAQIVSDISKKLDEDWTAYHQAHQETDVASTTLPTTNETTVDFTDKQYLQNLAKSVQQAQLERMKTPRTDFEQLAPVLPTTDTLEDSLGAADLDKLPGIGAIKIPNDPFSRNGSFGTYVILTSDRLLSEAEHNELRQNGVPIRLQYQPSRSVDGFDGTYIYRDRGQHPQNSAALQVVESKVKDDVRKQEAHDLAMKDADGLLKVAVQSGGFAGLANHTIIHTGTFERSAESVPNFTLSSKSVPRFVDGAFGLLQLQANESGYLSDRRLGVIDLPEAGRAVVVDLPLAEVKRQVRPGEVNQVATYMMYQNQAAVLRQWLSYEAVAQRNNIVINGSNPNPQQPQQPAPGGNGNIPIGG